MSKESRGSRWPPGQSIPDDWRTWAAGERGWSPNEIGDEAHRFADYWQAKPGREGRKLDWQATWRNWVRNSRRPDQLRVVGEPRVPI